MNQTHIKRFLECVSHTDDTTLLQLRRLPNSGPQHDLEFQRSAGIIDRKHSHESSPESSNSDILVAKATAMAVLFCASAICGTIPFLLNRYFKWTERESNARSALIVRCLLYFGGGVLLATTFLHLLPEVQEVVEVMEECDIIPSLGFPLAELLMCTGFFFMYFIEESIHAFIHHYRKNLNGNDVSAAAAFERGQSVRNSFLVRGKKQERRCNEVSERVSDDVITSEKDEQKTAPAGNTGPYSRSQHPSHNHLPLSEADGILTSSIRGLFIVLALSLHELFEGMAIGLENSSAAAVWFLFGAVSAHKLVLAFCVGVELIVARTRVLLAIIYVATFAIVSPIGIGVGILLSNSTGNNSAAPSIPAAMLQGLACGTLLFVVFFEILSKEHMGFRTFLALLVGFVTMFALQQIGTDDHHGHSHGDCGHSHSEDDHSHHNSVDIENKSVLDVAEQIEILRKMTNSLIKSN